MYDTDHDAPELDDGRVLEGGWQKAVAPPSAETRPLGLPAKPATPPPPPQGAAADQERANG